ncbi:MAG TPA: TonB-dependent receptor [Patescibacteria group bacterium]|nr:TonB-dependent receptor [Patescibacteria group bacterium]
MKKNHKRKKVAVTLLAGLMLSTAGMASAAAEEQVFDLDQVVVTATKTEKKVKEVPSAVEIITGEQLEKRNIKRISDALTAIPGVVVMSKKGVMGTTDSILMRGFGSQKQVLILLDGLPMNDGYSGGVDIANIPTENIDRIEVIKGPASALYGSNAMGGVINIITKEKAKTETILKTGIGAQGTENRSLYTSGSVGKWQYFLSGQKYSTDGYVTSEDYLTAKAGSDKAKYPGNNGIDRELYNAKLIYHPDERSKFTLTGGNNKYNYFYDFLADRGGRESDSWNLSYENKLTDTSLLKLSYGEQKIDSWYVSTSYSTTTNNISSYSYTQNPSKTTQAELQYNFKMGDKDSLVVGYSRKTENSDSIGKTLTAASKGTNLAMTTANSDSNIGGATKTDSFYIQDERKMDDKNTLYLGARYDNWSFYDGYTYGYNSGLKKYVTNSTPESSASSFNPKVGLVHIINDKLTMRSSIGKAFRAPNVYELAKDWESSTGSIYKSNPNLKPETAVNYEVGFDYQADKTLLLKMNLFHTDVTDVIDKKTYTNSAGRTVYQSINSGKARINGLEFSMNKKLSPSWNTFLNYTYTDSVITESEAAPENVDKQQSNVPRNMFNIGFDYNKGKWQGNIIGSYMSEANSPDKQGQSGYGTIEACFVVNTKISYKMSKDTTLSLSIDNLTDKKYYNYYLAPGRTTYLEFTHKF